MRVFDASFICSAPRDRVARRVSDGGDKSSVPVYHDLMHLVAAVSEELRTHVPRLLLKSVNV